MATEADVVKTRFLVISDTHSRPLHYENEADIAIHCGDLTNESKLEEYRRMIRDLGDIRAPLKLVVPGNHDFSLDIPNSQRNLDKARRLYPDSDAERLVAEYGNPGDARRLFEEARHAGIVLLDEGMHGFDLANGAHLTVYASPYTPAAGGVSGFQYRFEDGHEFTIERGADIVVQICSRPLLEPGHGCIAVVISTRVGVPNWLHGQLVHPRLHHSYQTTSLRRPCLSRICMISGCCGRVQLKKRHSREK
ncbi:putative rhamnogalacturonate lyase C 2 [Colletotrichum chlorophyti]|uniref:Putative rhamnogalacturonate lyase C 2 n=1 Tax=Colletotrichum chlorophyti TaxID=708187 RepID=A0A1Q8RW56_9PEZI|nr:putative rhamnogalacturonate lyase C 2 [Colletotrichum chlorophyti]